MQNNYFDHHWTPYEVLYVLPLLFIPVVAASLEYELGDAAMQCIDESLRDMGGCGVGGESETLGSTA
jgi:hypothetical protein